MSGWRAIVPLKARREAKTRLAGHLSRQQRMDLVAAMARHVVAQLRAAAGMSEVVVLSPEPPGVGGVTWLSDRGRGLNQELAPLFGAGPTLAIHGDLPLLGHADVEALLTAAERHGAALAPDRGGTGTNALAISAAQPFTPAFGHESMRRHRAALPEAGEIVRLGLSLDVDTPCDLELALAANPACLVGFG